MLKSKPLLAALVSVFMVSPVAAHDESQVGTGPDSMQKHVVIGERLIMELVLPHRYAQNNQLLINFFYAEGGVSMKPDRVAVSYSASGTDKFSDPVDLASNGPVYYGPATGITEPGRWNLRFKVTINAQTETLITVSGEFF